MPVRTWERLSEAAADGVELVGAGSLLEDLRAVKDAGELDAVRAAAELADEIVRAVVLEQGLAGRTERDVARAIERELRERGAEPSFPPIVAAAAHGALPHAEPRDVEIPRTRSWWSTSARWSTATARTARGPSPPGTVADGAREVYELVERAQAEALAAVAPGAACRDVDAVARDADRRGRARRTHFGHGLGHGVGLEVHEEPRLTANADGALAPGNVVTVEPGVYLAGRRGRPDRGPGGRDPGRARGPVRAAEGAHPGLEGAVFGESRTH